MINYFKNLPIIVYAKLLFGVLLIVMGCIEKNSYISIMGVVLILFALVLKGNCPGNSCNSNHRNKTIRKYHR